MSRWPTLLTILTLTACSGDTEPTGDADGSAAADTDTDTQLDTDTTPSETDTGWECNEWYPCQDCGGTTCGAEISACASNGTCGGALNTWAACVLDCGDPEVCADAFSSSGGTAAGDLLACVESTCAEICDL